MKRFCVAMVMLMTIAAVGCGNNKVADSGAASSTVSEPEAVPMIIDNGVFTDIGYSIPKNGEAEIETNWEWLYGKLEPGTYKITKTVLDSGASSEGDNLNRYTMSAQFLIAG